MSDEQPPEAEIVHIHPEQSEPGYDLAVHLGQQPVPETIMEDAVWWAENHNRVYWTPRRLREWCADHGPIKLPSGQMVMMVSDGYEWDSVAVRAVGINFTKGMEGTISGETERVERALDAALEVEPSLSGSIEVKYTLDHQAIGGAIRVPGPIAEALKDCRAGQSKLGVV